jgi:hypothetical protein
MIPPVENVSKGDISGQVPLHASRNAILSKSVKRHSGNEAEVNNAKKLHSFTER